MKITLAAIGKAKAGPERALFEHYLARLPWAFTLKELESKKATKASEADVLLEATSSADLRIALDEKGKSLTSPQLAKFLDDCQNRSEPHVAF